MTRSTTMDCAKFEEQMAELVAGGLDERTRGGLRAHARGCASCGPELARIEDAWALLAPAPAPHAVQAALFDRLEAERGKRDWIGRIAAMWSTGIRIPVPALAMFGAALAFSLWLNMRGPGQQAATLVAARESAPSLEAVLRAAEGERVELPARSGRARAAMARPAARHGVDVPGQAMAQLVAY